MDELCEDCQGHLHNQQLHGRRDDFSTQTLLAKPMIPNEQGERDLTVIYQRYMVNEVHPVRFGPLQDAIPTIITVIVILTMGHLLFYLLCLLGGEREVATDITFNLLWLSYIRSNQFFVGILVNLWIIGYNTVSWFIYRQFERRDVYPADDFYIATSERAANGGEIASHVSAMVQTPILMMGDRLPTLIQLPGDAFALGIQQSS